MAGVALGDIDLRSAWQAWHLLTSTFVLRGWRATYDSGLALVARLASRHFAWHGVALGNIDVAFAWQAWRSTLQLRGRPGLTLSLRGRRDIWHCAGSGGALGARWSPVTPWHFA